MKQKILLLLFLLLLLQGCSFNNFFMGKEEEVDQVTVVNYTSYKKHHRAYFLRKDLKPIKYGKKYLYLYRKKNNDLAILLHRNNKYLLYSMSKPNQRPYTMKVSPRTKLSYVLKSFRKYEYNTISSLASKGYVSTISYKKYKGLKTLLIETKKYSHLQSLYRSAIKSYNASKIRHIKTILPKQLIRNYYQYYLKRAKTQEQFIELRIIAKKLGFSLPSLAKTKPKKKVKTATKRNKKKIVVRSKPKHVSSKKIKVKDIEEENIEEEDIEAKPTIEPVVIKIKPIIKKPIISNIKPFKYYLRSASLSELSHHISNKKTKASLSHTQYTKLTNRLARLKEEKLLKSGSLEELIAAYKINKKPIYKQRIMSLMKDKQVTTEETAINSKSSLPDL